MKITTGTYLKKEDVPTPQLKTIATVAQETLKDKTGEKKSWVMYFDGEDKGLVLNKTNIKRLNFIFKSNDSDDWLGREIVLFNDPTIEFGGEIVGGLRLRAKVEKEAPKKAEPEADVPF